MHLTGFRDYPKSSRRRRPTTSLAGARGKCTPCNKVPRSGNALRPPGAGITAAAPPGVAAKQGLAAKVAQVPGVAATTPVQPEIHLRPNKLVKYEHVIAVMASAQRLGLKKIGVIGNEQFIN